LGAIDQIAQGYIGNSLLSGTINLTFQVGSGNVAAEDRISVSTSSGLLSNNLGLSSPNLSSINSAQSALTALDAAVVSVNLVVGEIGAAANRIEFASGNLAMVIENLDASRGTYNVVINSLAVAHKLSSESFASDTTALGLSGDLVVNG